jgi:hypothetical protein
LKLRAMLSSAMYVYDSSTDVASTRVQATQSQLDGLITIGSRYIQEFMTQYPGMRLELSKITNADLQLRSDYQSIFAGTKLRVTCSPSEALWATRR